MPRVARVRSATGVYHVLIRGRVDLIQDSDDVVNYIDIIREIEDEGKGKVYSYGFNRNHIHLIVEEKEGSIGNIITCMNLRYGTYYGVKYGFTGSLYVDRFLSMPIETIGYLCCVMDRLRRTSFISCKWGEVSSDALSLDDHQADTEVLVYVDKSNRKSNEEVLQYVRAEHGYTDKDDFHAKSVAERKKIVRDVKNFGASHKQLHTLFDEYRHLTKEDK